MSIFGNLSLFGYSLQKGSGAGSTGKLETFDVEKDDGAGVVLNQGGATSFVFESVTVPADDIEKIRTYRTIAASAEVDMVLNEIRNEMFILDIPGKKAIDITFQPETSKVSAAIQKKIHDEFDSVYRMLDFRRRGLEYFNAWYTDSRLYLHKVVDDSNKKEGIKKIVRIDSMKIRKIREIPEKDRLGLIDANKIKEFYIYSDVNLPEDKNKPQSIQTAGLKIQKDAITYLDSGLWDGSSLVGFLHKAIVPFNNLKMMEDSLIIYRVARAPERRIIYVDVGNLPKPKAEQYIRDLMNRFRNKLVYNQKTGSLTDKKNVLSMMEDYWLPRRDGGKGTEITTLPGGENLGITSDVEYFKSKLMESLNVPISRFLPEAPTFVFGKGAEISRDEYRFKKFINRLRDRFVLVFEDVLKTQLLLKNIITEDDWGSIRDEITWTFAEDNNFVDFKETESLNNKINTLTMIDPFVGKYFSQRWVYSEVMKLTEKQISELEKQIAAEQPASADDQEPGEQNDEQPDS